MIRATRFLTQMEPAEHTANRTPVSPGRTGHTGFAAAPDAFGAAEDQPYIEFPVIDQPAEPGAASKQGDQKPRSESVVT